MKCKVCGMESNLLDEVCYYDINGNSHSTEEDIERNYQNPDALAHQLCNDCADNFEFGEVKYVNKPELKVKILTESNMTLLPAAPGTCPECAVNHIPEMPHNRQSMFYQMKFHQAHGRWPTWIDAMAHCSDTVKKLWVGALMGMGVNLDGDNSGEGVNKDE